MVKRHDSDAVEDARALKRCTNQIISLNGWKNAREQWGKNSTLKVIIESWNMRWKSLKLFRLYIMEKCPADTGAKTFEDIRQYLQHHTLRIQRRYQRSVRRNSGYLSTLHLSRDTTWNAFKVSLIVRDHQQRCPRHISWERNVSIHRIILKISLNIHDGVPRVLYKTGRIILETFVNICRVFHQACRKELEVTRETSSRQMHPARCAPDKAPVRLLSCSPKVFNSVSDFPHVC